MTKSRGIIGKRHLWTNQEVEALRTLYPDFHADVVAKVLSIPISAVYQKAKKLGVEKSVLFQSQERERQARKARTDSRMKANHFKPGQQPWNKGSHHVAGGRSAETRFRKGNKPHTTLPIGSYRINRDGHLQRKVSEDSGSNSKRWRNVAELLWVGANGAVPEKHIVVFKPGMVTSVLEEITLDRIECISLVENMRRNSFRNKHPELARLVQLKGAITRQVNRIKRDAKELQK